jgi:hypothetical protein
MIHPILERAAGLMATSELLTDVARCRDDDGRDFTTGDAPLRALTVQEIASLEAHGNTAQDWARVRVADGFTCARIRDSEFLGDVVLGRLTGDHDVGGGVTLPSGIYRATIANCKIGHEVLIRDVRLLANYWVGRGALVHDCGRVVCAGPTAFGLGESLALGVETGGRDVPIFAEIDVAIAAAIANSAAHTEVRKRFAARVKEYTDRATSARGIIGPQVVLRHTPIIENTYLGPFSRVDGAQRITDCVLLGGHNEAAVIESGACVSHSVLQWNVRVSTLALVERTVLTECSGAERHAKVTSSLLGPNTVVGEGEITSSLVGPLVGFHHQALLISALWPEGKGNIAAGAQVGSNHTGRAADQEFCPGEGLFVGLGANIKFPADFRRSPYSVVACGVTTAPQSIAFPFSLITPATVSAPAGHNEIIPAWVLTESLYSVFRNEAKFRQRNRARRSVLAHAVFRPEIIDAMRDAVARLQAVAPGQAVYTDQQIAGLGKNILVGHHLQPSIDAYRFFIRFYALLGLLNRARELESRSGLPSVRSVLIERSVDEWEHQRRILCAELAIHDVDQALRELPTMAQQVAKTVEQSKIKDERRGGRIFSDYAEFHVATENDPVIQQVWQFAQSVAQDSADLAGRLAGMAGRPMSTETRWFAELGLVRP